MLSELFKINGRDLMKSAVVLFITTATTSVATTITSILQQIVASLQAGNLEIDFSQVLTSLVTGLAIGVLLGVVGAINYLLKNILTDQNGRVLGKY
jgi:ABC-type nitrate/sulfonate/bicarbonate transport system permease component